MMLEHKIKMLEEQYKGEKQSHEATKKMMHHHIEETKKEEEYIADRIDSKNRQIKELDRSIEAYKRIINSKEEELYSMKLHVGSISDTNAGEFTEVSKSPKSRSIKENPRVNTHADANASAEITTASPPAPRSKTPSILLIGTSNLKHIDPRRWTQYTTSKDSLHSRECYRNCNKI
jgi:hypothetical protein